MPNWRSMVDKTYLGAWDIPRDVTVEIAEVRSELLKSRENPSGKRKVVIAFRGARKRLVGNSTNCQIIEQLYGPDTDKWIGKRVTLYATTTSVGGRGQIPCIRIRPSIPRGQVEQIEEREPDPEMRAAQDEAFERQPGED